MSLPTTFTPGSSGIAEAFNQTNTAVNQLLDTPPIPGPAGATGPQGGVGPAGATGPQGAQGASGGFAHANFATPTDEWIFNHNLGYPPAVMTYDTNGVDQQRLLQSGLRRRHRRLGGAAGALQHRDAHARAEVHGLVVRPDQRGAIPALQAGHQPAGALVMKPAATPDQAITGGAQTLNITGGLVLPATGVATIPSSDAAGATASWVRFTFTARTATTITGTATGTGSGRTGIPFGGAAVTGTGYFRSGGYAINAGTNTGIYVTSCDFSGMYNGILLNGTLCSIQDSQFAGTINFDMQFNGPNVNSIVHNVTCDGSPPAVAHIEVNQCGSLLISDCDLIRANNNLRLNSSNAGAGVFGVYAMNTFFDTSVAGSSVKLTGNGFIQRVKFTSCWMSSAPAGYAGMEFASTAASLPTAIDLVNCDVYANVTNGILANGVQDFAVSGSRIAGSTNGILISASAGSVTKFRIVNNAITATGGFAAPTTPILINAGTYGGYQITDNDLRGGTTPLSDAGTTVSGAKSIGTNLGLITSPGAATTATLLSGTTYVTPQVIVPANSLRVGTTIQFTLLVTTSVGASNTTIQGKFGTAGTTADATVVSAATTGTAAAGSAEIMVTMVVRAVGSSGTAVVHARWLNNGVTGFANAASGLTTTTATINTTVTNYVGVALAASASGVTTVQSAIGNVIAQ